MIDRSNYLIAPNAQAIQQWLQCALNKFNGVVSFDLETTSKNPNEADIIGVGLSLSEDNNIYVDVRQHPQALTIIKTYLRGTPLRLVGQNLKYDLVVLSKYGVVPQEVAFDTLIAEYLLDPNLRRGRSLDDLSRKYLRHTCISFKELVAPTPTKSFAEVPIEAAGEYCCEDVDVALRLAKVLGPKLKVAGLERVFYDLEMPLLPVLAKIEARGIKIDSKYLAILERDFIKRKTNIQADIYGIVGGEFNINSSKQLQEILYEKLKIKKGKENKTGWSTDAATLQARRDDHPIVGHLLEWRKLDKLLSTYVSVLPERINKRTGRLHTSFNQAIAATGRLTSSGPNLQNIPARGEEGGQLRKAFISEAGQTLVVADYSQIELRVFAHYSEDAFLLEAYQQGLDIHEQTAKKIFKTEVVTKDQRMRAKTLNFGILYGMSPHRLAREEKMSLEEAQSFFDDYFNALPGVKELMDRCIRTSRKHGYSQTLMGRKRPLPDLFSSNFSKQRGAERMAVSTLIQGSAADIMKRCLIDLDNALNVRDARLILTVHDEVVIECDENKIDQVKEIVEDKMVNVVTLRVPLEVSIGQGKNWGDAK